MEIHFLVIRSMMAAGIRAAWNCGVEGLSMRWSLRRVQAGDVLTGQDGLRWMWIHHGEVASILVRDPRQAAFDGGVQRGGQRRVVWAGMIEFGR